MSQTFDFQGSAAAVTGANTTAGAGAIRGRSQLAQRIAVVRQVDLWQVRIRRSQNRRIHGQLRRCIIDDGRRRDKLAQLRRRQLAFARGERRTVSAATTTLKRFYVHVRNIGRQHDRNRLRDCLLYGFGREG